MTAHRIVLALWLATSLASPGLAASGTTTTKPKPAARRAVAHPAAPTATPRAHGTASSRTLDDIHIEGEIPVPQVLFITARDQRRFVEFQHRQYLKSCRELGEDTPRPTTNILTRFQPDPRKENPR